MESIITVVEFQTFKHISKKVDTDRIEQAISFAQEIDLYDYLGDFLFDVVAALPANGELDPYNDLLNGGSFTVEEKNYIHAGIKSLLADLTYVRYLNSSNVVDTPFGLVSKDANDSSPIDRGLIKDLASQAMRDADVKFSLINMFLEENASDFPRYSEGDNPNINTNRTRFEVLPQRDSTDNYNARYED